LWVEIEKNKREERGKEISQKRKKTVLDSWSARGRKGAPSSGGTKKKKRSDF